MAPARHRSPAHRAFEQQEAPPLATAGTLTQPAPDERPKPDRLFRNTEFLRLWGGQTVSSVGSGIVKLAAPLLVLALTESPTMAGLVGGALTFPMIFLGLPAGALVDRWDRRRVMIVCDAVRCLAVLTVPVAWLLGALNGWLLFGVALALGSAQSFYNICQIAALPQVVTRRQINAAQALNSTSEGVATLASPGLGGMIVALGPTVIVGGVLAYCVNGLTFLVSVLALLGIKTPFQARRSREAQRGIMRSIVEGLHYVYEEHSIRLLMILNGVHRFGFAPVMLIVVVLARQDLGLDPTGIGLLFSVAGCGGLSAAAITPWLRRRIPVGWHMIAIVALHGVALGLAALAPSIWLMLRRPVRGRDDGDDGRHHPGLVSPGADPGCAPGAGQQRLSAALVRHDVVRDGARGRPDRRVRPAPDARAGLGLDRRDGARGGVLGDQDAARGALISPPVPLRRGEGSSAPLPSPRRTAVGGEVALSPEAGR